MENLGTLRKLTDTFDFHSSYDNLLIDAKNKKWSYLTFAIYEDDAFKLWKFSFSGKGSGLLTWTAVWNWRRSDLTLFDLGFLREAQLGGGGGRRWKVPTAYNSKTINDNEIKLGGVVKDQ